MCGWLYEGLVPKGATFRLFEGHTLFLSDMMGFPRRIHTNVNGRLKVVQREILTEP